MAYQVFCEGLLGFGKCTVVGREEESAVQSSYKDLIRSKTTQIKIEQIIHFPNSPQSCCFPPSNHCAFLPQNV